MPKVTFSLLISSWHKWFSLHTCRSKHKKHPLTDKYFIRIQPHICSQALRGGCVRWRPHLVRHHHLSSPSLYVHYYYLLHSQPLSPCLPLKVAIFCGLFHMQLPCINFAVLWFWRWTQIFNQAWWGKDFFRFSKALPEQADKQILSAQTYRSERNYIGKSTTP